MFIVTEYAALTQHLLPLPRILLTQVQRFLQRLRSNSLPIRHKDIYHMTSRLGVK